MSASTEQAELDLVPTPVVSDEITESQEIATPEADPSSEEVVTDEAKTSDSVDEKSDADKKAESRAFFANRKVRKELKDAEVRNTALQAKLDESTQVTPTEEPELKIEDFAFDEDALNEAKIQREVTKQVQIARQADREQAVIDASQKQMSDFQHSQATYGAKNPEYIDLAKEVDDAGIRLPEALNAAILDSDSPVQVHHLILADTTLLETMDGMSPIQLVKAVGALEAQVMPEAKKPTPKNKSNAPAPISSEVGGGGSQGGDSLDTNDPDISNEEYERRMKAKWHRDNPR